MPARTTAAASVRGALAGVVRGVFGRVPALRHSVDRAWLPVRGGAAARYPSSTPTTRGARGSHTDAGAAGLGGRWLRSANADGVARYGRGADERDDPPRSRASRHYRVARMGARHSHRT